MIRAIGERLTGLEGKVARWSRDYGFIESPDIDQDVFVHYTQIISGNQFKRLHVGDRVAFNAIHTAKGWQALDVKVIS